MIRWHIKTDDYEIRCYRNQFYLKVFNDDNEVVLEYRTRRIIKALREIHDVMISLGKPSTVEELLALESKALTHMMTTGLKCIEIYNKYKKGVEKHD